MNFDAAAINLGSSSTNRRSVVADGVGFEPTDACTSPVFKTGALNHSATHPAMPLLCVRHDLFKL
jgi:hypothetical protein